MVAMISEYSRRPLRALMADGLNDIVTSLYYLCATLLAYNGVSMGTAMQRASSLREDLAISHHFEQIDLFIVLLPFIAACVVEPVRRRFVHPRTGYVLPGGPKDHRLLGLVVWGIIALLGVTLLVSLLMWLANRLIWSSLPLDVIGKIFLSMIGTGFALVFGGLFLRFGFVRHLIIAGTSLVTTILLISTPVDFRYYFVLFYLVLTIVTMAVGIDAFMKILRIPVATEQDVE